VLSLLMLFGVQETEASAREWQLDPAHTGFYFSVDHIYAKVRGSFLEFTGTVVFDPEQPGESSMKFVIRTDSIDTGVAKRDKHLQSDDFFAAGDYPEMVFESVSISPAGENRYNVAGKLTIKGKSYDLVLPLTLGGIREHPAEKNKLVIGFNGALVLDRLDYGVGSGKFYEAGLVGRKVEVLVSFEALAEK